MKNDQMGKWHYLPLFMMINELIFCPVCRPAPITSVISDGAPPVAQINLSEEHGGTTSKTQAWSTARCHCYGRVGRLLLALRPGLFDFVFAIRSSTCIVRMFSLFPWLIPGPGPWTTLLVFPSNSWFRQGLITSSHKARGLAFYVGYGLSMAIHLK